MPDDFCPGHKACFSGRRKARLRASLPGVAGTDIELYTPAAQIAANCVAAAMTAAISSPVQVLCADVGSVAHRRAGSIMPSCDWMVCAGLRCELAAYSVVWQAIRKKPLCPVAPKLNLRPQSEGRLSRRKTPCAEIGLYLRPTLPAPLHGPAAPNQSRCCRPRRG